MNTYETMKYNIPEGAERYFNQDSSDHFAWYKKGDGKFMVMVIDDSNAHSWDFCNYSEYDRATPIHKPTYRYEKVTDYIFDLKEEFERGELFSFDGDEHYVQIETEGDFSYAHVHESIYRRIEVTERELFIEKALLISDSRPLFALDELFGDLYDSGEFDIKIVDVKG